MVNGKNLKRFSLDARHFHPRRTHWHPWNRQPSDIGPFPQKALDCRCRYMPFNHISLHISGVARSVLRADTGASLCRLGLACYAIGEIAAEP